MCQRTLLVVLLLSAPLGAQEKPAADQAIEVSFADESVVKMMLNEPSIAIMTRYGRLTIPIADVRRIDFGARVSPEMAKRIDAAVSKLGGTDAAARETATAELMALREAAVPALRRAASSDNPQLSGRAAELHRQLIESLPAERQNSAERDTIITPEFTIVGQIETESLKARSAYFGQTTLNVADLRRVRLIGEEVSKSLTLDLAQVVVGQGRSGWVDTGIAVRAGMNLQVTASGSGELHANDGSVSQISPDGLGSRSARGFGRGGAAGAFPPGGNPAGGFGAAARDRGRNPGTFTPGVLVGRIGRQGSVFIIGSRYQGANTEDGRLFLWVFTNPEGGKATGSYSVRVSTGN